MEETLFPSIMTTYSMLYSIALCLHRTELFHRCVGGKYIVETDKGGVKQSNKCLKFPFKTSFLRLIK